MFVKLDDARKAWLAGLKAGDKVFCSSSRRGGVKTVVRLTEKQVVMRSEGSNLVGAGESRAHRSNGYMAHSNDYGHIEPLTQEILDDIRERKIETWARYEATYDLRLLTFEQKAQVFDIVRNMVEANKAQKAKVV